MVEGVCIVRLNFRWLACLLIAVLLCPLGAAAADSGIYVNSYYALSSYSERQYAQYSDQVALAWGEVRQRDGVIYFSQQKEPGYDYGVPAGDIQALVDEMKNGGAKLKLSVFLNNKDNVLKDLLDSPQAQQQVIEQMTSDMRIKYYDYSAPRDSSGAYPSYYVTGSNGSYIEYDGIIIDFEGLYDTYADRPGISYSARFDEFLDRLRAALPRGKELSVCIHPKRASNAGYYNGYDYAHIGAVADEVILMAHDYQWYGGGSQRISASAPYALVDEAIRLAISQIKPQKILLQISLAPVQWTKDGAKYKFGSSTYSAMVSAINGENSDQAVIDVTPAGQRYDSEQRVGYAYLKRYFYSDGTYQYAQEDEFYFENRRSVSEKIGLIKKYGLKGLSIWRLGLGATDVLNQVFGIRLPVSRIEGADRYETAAAISRQGWSAADSVVLASGVAFPDALSGAALAYLENAPVLLVGSGAELPEATEQEIRRLNPQRIYVLGGTGAVSKDIEDYLSKQGYNVIRIQGKDRYETAVEIGQLVRQYQKADTAVIATGADFPDALSIAPFSALEGMPILFTGKDSLDSRTKQALKEWGIKHVIIVGGTGVISGSVADALESMGIGATRLGGANRYLTSLEIAKYFNKAGYRGLVMATGQKFPDALSGAVFAAKKGMPIILMGAAVDDRTVTYASEMWLQQLYVLGGTGAVPDQIVNKISLPSWGQ